MWQRMFFKVVLWAGGVLIGLGVLGALLGGPPAPEDASGQKAAEEPPQPASPLEKIKALNASFSEVANVAPEILTIRYAPDSIFSSKTWVKTFFCHVKETLPKLDEAAPGHQYKSVVFFVEMPTTDNLGNPGKAPVMNVTYTFSDLEGANWSKINNWRMAELASDVVFHRQGLEGVANYCEGEREARNSPRFCARVLARLIQ